VSVSWRALLGVIGHKGTHAQNYGSAPRTHRLSARRAGPQLPSVFVSTASAGSAPGGPFENAEPVSGTVPSRTVSPSPGPINAVDAGDHQPVPISIPSSVRSCNDTPSILAFLSKQSCRSPLSPLLAAPLGKLNIVSAPA
jgi:hypothetical protein